MRLITRGIWKNFLFLSLVVAKHTNLRFWGTFSTSFLSIFVSIVINARQCLKMCAIGSWWLSMKMIFIKEFRFKPALLTWQRGTFPSCAILYLARKEKLIPARWIFLAPAYALGERCGTPYSVFFCNTPKVVQRTCDSGLCPYFTM